MIDEILNELQHHIEGCEQKVRKTELEQARAVAFTEGMYAARAIIKGIIDDNTRCTV